MSFLLCKIGLAEVLTRQELAKKALAATIHLVLVGANDEKWTGSGFFVRSNHIATNFHVIEDATAANLGAKLVNQTTAYTIESIRAVDKKRDLAILQVSAPGVKPLPLSDSDAIEIGDTVYAVGNPRGLEGTCSNGIISQIRGKGAEKLLQFTASISKGNSGGPVLNEDGEVIGVVSFRIPDIRNFDYSGNLNFAIPSNYLKVLIEKLGDRKQSVPKVSPPKPKPPSSPSLQRKLERGIVPSVPQLAQRAIAATVSLEVQDENGAKLGRGSGFFVRRNLIATNFHVIDGASRASVKLVNTETKYRIEGVTATDEKNDLALLKVAMYGVTPLALGNSNMVQIGETVYVVGNPKNFEGTVSDGIISGRRDRGGEERLQMTAPISPGSSGGPVLNRKGEVIGVSVSLYNPLFAQNLNFAIPSNALKALLARSGRAKPLSRY